MEGRPRRRSKFSTVALVVDHYDTFRDAQTGSPRFLDVLWYLSLPVGLAVFAWTTGAKASSIPEVLAAVAILTGLIFNVFVLLFDLTMRATDKTDPGLRPLIDQLADELRANISYAVLLGLTLTFILGGFAMFGEPDDSLPPPVTAIVIFLAVQMLLTIAMVLKRIRALYRAFRTAGGERIP